MRLRDLSDVKVEVIAGGVFHTPWTYRGKDVISWRNPLTGETEFELFPDGVLKVYAGFMCDGPSGPTVDDASNRIPAVVHDVAYAMLRYGIAPPSLTRKSADSHMHKMLIDHGMSAWRARLWYIGLRAGAARAARRTIKTPKKYQLLSC